MNKTIFLICSSLACITPLQSMNKPPKTLFSYTNDLQHKLTLEKKQRMTISPLSFFQEQPHWRDIQNIPHAAKNYALHILPFSNYEEYCETVKYLVSAGGDPNTIPLNGQLPLAVALHHADYEFVEFLLENFANPNLFVNPTYTDMRIHQEAGLHPTTNTLFAGKPSFYFAKRVQLAQLCLLYGARIKPNDFNERHSTLTDHDSVLAHVIDNKDYSADLIDFYLAYGVGPYHPSSSSNGGSILHHVMHTLTETTDAQNIERLLACTEHLIEYEPGLLTTKDRDSQTPRDIIEDAPTVTEVLRKEVIQLFKRNKLRE